MDTGIGDGHSITACCDHGLVVVGGVGGGKVAWSEDDAETFNLTDKLPTSDATGEVHVACDPLCEGIIYAAVSGVGIYRTDIDDGSWEDLDAMPYDYFGIVMSRSDGTLYAATNEITVDLSKDCDEDGR